MDTLNNIPLVEDEFDGVHNRPTPHDEEAERSVLAQLLKDNQLFAQLDVLLTPEDFYTPRHQLIFKTIHKLCEEQGQAADILTLGSALKDSDELSRAGGRDYLLELDSYADYSTNFHDHVGIVRDKATLRSLARSATGIVEQVHKADGKGCKEQLDEAERSIFELSNKHNSGSRESTIRISKLTEPVSDEIERLGELRKQGLNPLTGLQTHFPMLDSMTSGLQASDLIVLAARPSVGKTSFALDVLRQVCQSKTPTADRKGGKMQAAALFSLEMSSEQITRRMLSMEAKIDQHRMRTGELNSSSDWQRFTKAMTSLNKWPLWIDDTPLLTVLEMRSRVRRIMREAASENSELKLIVVDYLQLMDTPNSSNSDNRATEVAQISRGLKALAREMKMPVMALSQLSRRVEERKHSRPQLSDLRESGAIEQDADVIMFLSRAAQPDGPEEEYSSSSSSSPDNVELYVGKHRNGPIGSIQLNFDRRYTHFSEQPRHGYDPDDQPPPVTERGDLEDYQFNS